MIQRIPDNFGRRKILCKRIVYNKQRTIKLDTSRIRLNQYDKKKGIELPNKLTEELAEETGIHYGDGFLSLKKNDFRIKGHKIDEKEYYDIYIKQLYKRLYNLDLNLKEYETTYGFEIYCRGIKEFKTKILDIPAGRKENIRIPKIINEGDYRIKIAFIRGMFDTDGSITLSSRKPYKNYYPIISLWQKSEGLVRDLTKIFSDLGFNPRVYTSKKWEGLGLSLNGYDRFSKYCKLIGFHNPKHLKKIEKWKRKSPQLQDKSDGGESNPRQGISA